MKGPPAESSSVTSCSTGLRDIDYSEYIWMGEEMEEFDTKCLQEFCEEEFIESCFEDLFEEEANFEEELETYLRNLSIDQIEILFNQMDAVASVGSSGFCSTDAVESENSRLNPNAPEFIPRKTTAAPAAPSLRDGGDEGGCRGM